MIGPFRPGVLASFHASPLPLPPERLPSKAKTWAAARIVKQTSGEQSSTPVGDICEECFQGWKEVLSAEFPKFEDMVRKCAHCKETASRVQQAYDVFGGKTKKVCNDEACESRVDYSIRIDRSFVIMNEREMRQALGRARVLKAQTRGLHSMTVPSEVDPSRDEEVWFFDDPSAPHRRATISATVGVGTVTQHMPLPTACYEGQSRFNLKRAFDDKHSGLYGIFTAKLPEVESFVAQHRAPEASGSEVSDDDRQSADSDAEQGEIVGIGAAVANSTMSTTTGPPSLCSFRSPGRSRPPVPRFADGARAASPAPSASVGPTLDGSDDDGSDSGIGDDLDDADGGPRACVQSFGGQSSAMGRR